MKDTERIMLTLQHKKRNRRWLAESIGIDPSTMTLLLQGKLRLQGYQKRAIANALDVPETVLFCSDGDAQVVTE